MGLPDQAENREIDLELKLNAEDLAGSSLDGFRSAILGMVSDGAFELAVDEMNYYITEKKDYPEFKQRTDRYVEYAIDLINAIQAKSRFVGNKALSTSKRKEMIEIIHHHFVELGNILEQVEKVEKNMRLEDVRSTVWVIQAIMWSLAGLLIAGVAIELMTGLASSAVVVVSHFFDIAINGVFDFFGW